MDIVLTCNKNESQAKIVENGYTSKYVITYTNTYIKLNALCSVYQMKCMHFI